MVEHAEELAGKIWKTSGARFNAYRRLKTRHFLSTLTTAMLSLYVVFIQLVSYVVPQGTIPVGEGLLALGTGFLATAILTVSLVEFSRSYELHAERLHDCGKELTALYDELKNGMARFGSEPAKLSDAIESVTQQYHYILEKTAENHEPGDYELFKAQHRADFGMSWLKAAATRLLEAVRAGVWYYLAMASAPVVLLAWWLI